MGNHGCDNGSLADANYSRPVPIIGVYIFAASLACVLVILYDVVVAGILPRKRWLPCKYFQLNSVTLTLLAVATKIPVDLTTAMPGPHDQLSKLTGTAIICVSMAFLAPSLGANGESECFTNMVALTIFVVTVAANIIIQLCTQVIVLFFVEHIIMLILMMILLMMLWHISFYIKVQKRIDTDKYSNLLSKGGSDSMFERLKSCYVYAYSSNPQYKISMYPMNVAVSAVCLGCCGIIVETTVRSIILKQLEFCGGDSDYSWSMKLIVFTQIAAVLVGTIACLVRCFTLFSRMELDSILVSFLPNEKHVVQMNGILKAKAVKWHGLWGTVKLQKDPMVQLFIVYPLQKAVLAVQLIIMFPLQWLRDRVFGIDKDDNGLEYFEEVSAIGYIVRKSVDDMIKFKTRVSSPGSQYQPSRYLDDKKFSVPPTLADMVIKEGIHSIKVCSLSVALLVKIAEASIPKKHLAPLLKAFDEAKDVIHFIDEIIQPKNEDNNHGLEYAKALWMGGSFTRVVSGCARPTEDHAAAVETIRQIKTTLKDGDTWELLRDIINFINNRGHHSVEELYQCIEVLFVDMLHMLYAHLPTAICKSLRASSAEDFEENVRVALEFLFEIGSLNCQNSWLYVETMASMEIINRTASSGASGASGQLQRLANVKLDSRNVTVGNQNPRHHNRPTFSTICSCWNNV